MQNISHSSSQLQLSPTIPYKDGSLSCHSMYFDHHKIKLLHCFNQRRSTLTFATMIITDNYFSLLTSSRSFTKCLFSDVFGSCQCLNNTFVSVTPYEQKVFLVAQHECRRVAWERRSWFQLNGCNFDVSSMTTFSRDSYVATMFNSMIKVQVVSKMRTVTNSWDDKRTGDTERVSKVLWVSVRTPR